MKIQIENVSKQIKDFCESLVFNGLNLVTQESIREIEFFLQNASQLEAYRLAISLRYLHVELKRFLENSPAFNTERYVFFLCNCWLHSRAFISFAQTKEEDVEFYKSLMGIISETEIMSKLILRLIGIEKVRLEGTMMGLVFYFISLYGSTRGEILKWNLMFPHKKGNINPSVVLQLTLPNSEPPCTVDKIISNYLEIENIPCAIKEGNIFLKDSPDIKVFIDETPEDIFSSKLEKFYFDSDEIYKRITQDYEVTPFDLPANFLDYLFIKHVKIKGVTLEGKNETNTPINVYTIDHEKDYCLFIRIPDKLINQDLIRKINDCLDKSNLIDGLFCKLILERGQLGLYPLSVMENNKIKFPNISEVHTLDNREFLKKMYKITK